MTTKRNGGLRKAVPVALGLAFALVLAGCDNGSTNGGNVNLVACTLRIYGQQVYEDLPPLGGMLNPTWERFFDNRTVTFGGAEGTIANGWLDFEIGTPDNLGNIRDVLNNLVVDVRLGDNVRLADWDNIVISNGNARAAWLSLETDEGEAIHRSFSVFGDSLFHGIRHIFVDNYVTISAVGNQEIDVFVSYACNDWDCFNCGECPPHFTETTEINWNAFSIALTPGWNALGFTSYRHPLSGVSNSITFTVLPGDHDYARWVLVENW